MSDRTPVALLVVALLGTLAYAVKTADDKRDLEFRLTDTRQALRDAFIREANSARDPIAALRALAIDDKNVEARRALFEANFATWPNTHSARLHSSPSTLRISPEIGTDLHVFTAASGTFERFDESETPLECDERYDVEVSARVPPRM